MDHDIHADAVHDLVVQRGYKSYRLDPEAAWTPSGRPSDEAEWAPSGRLAWYLCHHTQLSALEWHGQDIDLKQVGAVYCRNFQFAKARDDASIEEHLRYAEMRAGLFGLFRTLDHCFWMNKPWIEESLDNKMVQGLEASKSGLKVPKTLVTNDEARARAFIDGCDGGAIIKQLSEIGLIDDTPAGTETYGFYSSVVTEEMLKYLDEVELAPCLFQENIPKKADIRATVVGNRIFAYAIDSQSNSASKTDFRRVRDLPFTDFEFPHDVGSKLIKMLERWGVVFAACDFVLTPNDELVFLEANFCGNWLWLEEAEEHPVLDEIVRTLVAHL